MNVKTRGETAALPEYGLLIGGEWVDGAGAFEVRDKFTGEPVARVARASPEQAAAAVAAARASFERQALEPYARYRVLLRAADLIEARREEIARTIVAESGFTVADARLEIDRCVQTLVVSAEEAKRITGEMVPIDGAPGQAHRLAFTIRVPIGVVCAITPFNSPLNTVTHKVAPALAAGNAVVLKPASYTPVTAALLCEVLTDAGLPPGHVNLVQGGGSDVGQALLDQADIDFYTFTGSTAVGKVIRRSVGLRRTSLELGSISGTIVCEDADLGWAAPRCVRASFRKAGQVCTSVQRLYVHEPIVERLVAMLIAEIRRWKVGDPYDPETLVGPMIDVKEAERAEAWVSEAVEQGARIVHGGEREGAVLYPTILTDVRPDMRVMCEEIFAPVISIVPYRSFDEALEGVNGTPFGLAAGVFTADLERAFAAARRLRVGAVHINETSSSRVDLMPYGGVKESGYGQEGPRYAIREMTEERLVTISLMSKPAARGDQ
ncbi:MAG: aldehyde dehydrogenase family protein [Gemmatimonadetes bacterium]|nr:aldehyde dehydrogenase family protein [Gemmatimonadota bacterium]